MQVLNGDRGLRPEVLDQLRVVRLQLLPGGGAAIFSTPTRLSRVTSGAHSIDASRRLSLAAGVVAVVVEQGGKLGRRLDPSTPASCRRGDRSRRPAPTAAAPTRRPVIGSVSPIR